MVNNVVPATDFERQHLGAEMVTLTELPPAPREDERTGLFDARVLKNALSPYRDDPRGCEARRQEIWRHYGLDPERPYRVFRNTHSPRYYVVQNNYDSSATTG